LSKVIDLTGQRFGRLEALRRIGSKNGAMLWECQCDCGNTKITNRSNLKGGHTQSCGCLSKELARRNINIARTKRGSNENLVGQTFGRLKVIKRGKHPSSSIYWRCLCDPILGGCGNFTTVRASHLRSGHTSSCGCFARDNRRLLKGQASIRHRMRDYKKRAKSLDYTFEIDEIEFTCLTQENCYYCGSPPLNIVKARHNNGDYVCQGLDRVDNTKGYTIDNVVPCCAKCNWMKRDMDRNSWFEHMASILKHTGHIND